MTHERVFEFRSHPAVLAALALSFSNPYTRCSPRLARTVPFSLQSLRSAPPLLAFVSWRGASEKSRRNAYGCACLTPLPLPLSYPSALTQPRSKAPPNKVLVILPRAPNTVSCFRKRRQPRLRYATPIRKNLLCVQVFVVFKIEGSRRFAVNRYSTTFYAPTRDPFLGSNSREFSPQNPELGHTRANVGSNSRECWVKLPRSFTSESLFGSNSRECWVKLPRSLNRPGFNGQVGV